MPKGNNAPSMNWDVNNHITQSKVINENNQKELDKYKAKTEAYARIDSTLSEYEAQGIDTSIYRKKLEEKVPELPLIEKLGVVGRNIEQDYVKSVSKALGGNPELTHSQKMDNLKMDREAEINPISTIGTEVLLDPATYTPIPFVKGATKLAQFGKNAVTGSAVSGGLYTAKEYGDEDYDPIDSLIAAGFGGVLNGTIAAALGKTAPKTIKEKAIKETDPIINETFEEKFIGDDEIVNKMMGNVEDKVVQPKEPSIFGFDKVDEKPDIFGFNKNNVEANNIPNAVEANQRVKEVLNNQEVIKKPNLQEQNNIELPPMQQQDDLLFQPKQTSKLPDVLPTNNRQEMEEIIKYAVKNNAEDEFISKLPQNADIDKTREFLLSLKPSQPKAEGIIPVSINKKQPIKNYNHNMLHEFEGVTKAIGQNTSDVLDGLNTNTIGVRSAINRYIKGTATQKDYEVLDTIERYMTHEGKQAKEYINTPKNIDDAVANNVDYETADKAGVIPFSNGSQTFGGGAVGGLESEFNERDYNNDGKHDYKDNLVGALVGAIGINAARKLMPKVFKDKNINENTMRMLYPKGKPNFKTVGKIKDITKNKTNINLSNKTRETAGINNKPIVAYLDILKNKHPELFKNEKEVFKHILEVKNNPTHFVKGNPPSNSMIVNKDGKYTKKISIEKNNEVENLLVHALRSSKNTELRRIIKKQLEGSPTPSRPSLDGTAADGTKVRSVASDKNSITKDITKSQDATINASPTLSGSLVGGASGAEVDYDGDGKQTYKDILYGAIGGAGATKGVLSVKNTKIANKATEKLKKIADTDFIDAFSGHKIYAKKGYMKAREKMIASKNAKMEDFVQLHEQLKLLSDDARKNLHKYMSGERNTSLSPSLKTFADDYIKQVETKGQELVDLGILEKAQYDKFKGKYLHRVYEKDLTKSVTQAFKKGKTIPGVHTRGREWTGTKTEYEKLLSEGKIGDFHGGKIEARKLNNGQYKFTQDWSAEQRARWGEIEDIAYTLPETLQRMSEMAEHGKMLKNVSMQTQYIADEALDGYTQLKGKRFGALRDKYVPKDIADDINEFNRAMFGEEDGAIFSKEVKEAYGVLSTFWKKSHTVYNPTAHANNLLSNVMMQYMQGINPIKAIANAKRGAVAHMKLGEFRKLTAKTLVGLTPEETNKLKALTLDDDLKLYIKAEKAGLFGRSKLNDILGQYQSPTNKKSKVPGSLRKIDEVSSEFYQGEDNIMRFSLLKSLTDNGKSFDSAIKEVNNTIPDYTKPMSRMAKFGRKSMLTPFISWTYYSTPIILRQLKEHPERAIVLMGALYGINKAFGIDPYDKKDIPQQNFSMKRIPVYKNGKEVTTLKVDRWMPHNEILSPHDFVKNLTNGGAWKGGYEVLNNQNLYYGGKITYKEGGRKAYDIFKHGTQQITPDAIDKIWNLTESAILSKDKRKKNPVIQPRNSVQETLNILGLNTLTYDKRAQKMKVLRERIK